MALLLFVVAVAATCSYMHIYIRTAFYYFGCDVRFVCVYIYISEIDCDTTRCINQNLIVVVVVVVPVVVDSVFVHSQSLSSKPLIDE